MTGREKTGSIAGEGKMAKCQYCGKEVKLPYRCNYCGGFFCDDHRLPPKHDCQGIAQWEAKATVKFPKAKSATTTTTLPSIPDEVFPAAEPDEPIPGWEDYGITRDELDHLYQLPFRKYCYQCGKYIYNDLQFICSVCGLSFCEEHKLPEAHNCMGQRKYVLPPNIGYKELLNMCEICGKIGEVSICKFCGGTFCKDHVIPSMHDCKEYEVYRVRVEGKGARNYVATPKRKEEPKVIRLRKPKHYPLKYLLLVIALAILIYIIIYGIV